MPFRQNELPLFNAHILLLVDVWKNHIVENDVVDNAVMEVICLIVAVAMMNHIIAFGKLLLKHVAVFFMVGEYQSHISNAFINKFPFRLPFFI